MFKSYISFLDFGWQDGDADGCLCVFVRIVLCLSCLSQEKSCLNSQQWLVLQPRPKGNNIQESNNNYKFISNEVNKNVNKETKGWPIIMLLTLAAVCEREWVGLEEGF